jgi:hypothetical protein
MSIFIFPQFNDDTIGDIGVFHSTGGFPGGHAGILFRKISDNTLSFLHLAWHCKVSIVRPKLFGYTSLNLSEEDIGQVAALSAIIQDKPESVDVLFYGQGASPVSKITIIDNSLVLFLGDNCQGLSCATFVLSILNGLGSIVLLNTASWDNRDAATVIVDKEWIKSICRTLCHQYPGDEKINEHIRNLMSHQDSYRIRPLQIVGAACQYSNTPITFGEAQQEANALAAGWNKIGIPISNV